MCDRFRILHSKQEAFVGISFGQHAHIPIKMTYLESSCQELSIRICKKGPIRGGGGGGGSEFFRGGLQKFTGPFLGNLKYIIGMLSSSPVNWHPF